MFYYEIPWFYQDFKSENLCFLYLYSVHAVRIPVTTGSCEVLQNEERNTFTTIKTFPSCRYNISIFRGKIH